MQKTIGWNFSRKQKAGMLFSLLLLVAVAVAEGRTGDPTNAMERKASASVTNVPAARAVNRNADRTMVKGKTAKSLPELVKTGAAAVMKALTKTNERAGVTPPSYREGVTPPSYSPVGVTPPSYMPAGVTPPSY